MIQFFNVAKFFDNIPALINITLAIDKGELVYVTGASGAGKTTLLRLVYMAEEPDEGSIFVAGWDTGKLKQGTIPLLRRNIGIVFQDYRLLQNKTLFDNVALPLQIQGIHPKEIREDVYKVLEDVGLKNRAGDLPQHLSGGQQQMASIVRAMVSKPTILLADEPTGNLDPDTATTIIRLLKEINIKGTTVVIATHNKELFSGSGRRVIYLKEGKIEKEAIG